MLNTFFVDIDSKFDEKNLEEEREIKEAFRRFTSVCNLVSKGIDKDKKIVGKRKNYINKEEIYFQERKRIKIIIETELNNFYSKYRDIEKQRIRESDTPLSRIIQVYKKSESTSPTLLGDSNSPTMAF